MPYNRLCLHPGSLANQKQNRKTDRQTDRQTHPKGNIREYTWIVWNCYKTFFPLFSRFPEGYKVPQLYMKVREACRKNFTQVSSKSEESLPRQTDRQRANSMSWHQAMWSTTGNNHSIRKRVVGLDQPLSQIPAQKKRRQGLGAIYGSRNSLSHPGCTTSPSALCYALCSLHS